MGGEFSQAPRHNSTDCETLRSACLGKYRWSRTVRIDYRIGICNFSDERSWHR
jgi:hypothetical protein